MEWHKFWLFLTVVFLLFGASDPAILTALATAYTWPGLLK
jgi:hypothetical protein